MIKMDNVVRCYRVIDPVDGADSIFAVKNGLVAPALYMHEKDMWLTPDGFGQFCYWDSRPDDNDEMRLSALDAMELLWEKQE